MIPLPKKLVLLASLLIAAAAPVRAGGLPKVHVAPGTRSFATDAGEPFVPFGVTWYRPGTGWAPQLWKQFDEEAARRDFARMKELGVNCVRVFLTFGSFYQTPGKLSEEGLAKFDRFLAIAEQAGIYVHPTGPDHWEGLPEFARTDRFADGKFLSALEDFWKLFAGRYRGRSVIFAWDLLNEPEVGWDTPVLRERWKHERGINPVDSVSPNDLKGEDLLEYQHFRERVAVEWTRRQCAAIKSSDPDALVTVGLIQWSVPVLLPAGPRHYSAFRPEKIAPFLDFIEVHFYPLANGAFEYTSAEEERKNLSYLDSVVRATALPGKPLVIAEFGWYGGLKPKFDQGRHPAASEEQQARWCSSVIEQSKVLATGWLNWGFHDQPEASDVSEGTGLLKADGSLKVWGREFQKLARDLAGQRLPAGSVPPPEQYNWDDLITSREAGDTFRRRKLQAR